MPRHQPSRSVAAQADASIDDYRWLTSAAATHYLEGLAASSGPLIAQIARLRRELSAQRTHLAVQQATLRRRARAKFAAADRMFFTPLGLEQATDEIVAAYKARRFAGKADIFDLCSGIGGDLVALSRVATTTGFERDPIAALLAQANLRAACDAAGRPSTGAQVRLEDVTQLDVARAAAWHIDPDRRPAGRRTTRVELHQPDAAAIDALLRRNVNAAVKLAPAATLPDAWSAAAELEWIGRDRECRQLVAWFGELAGAAGRHRATVLRNGASEPRTIVGTPAVEPPATGRVGRFVFEPHAAVLAAGLAATLAAEHGASPITAKVAYRTADAAVEDPALSCFEVREVLPLDVKRLKALLRARKIGRLEIKQRGVTCKPEALRRQLGLAGDHAAVLLLLPIEGRSMAILAQRFACQHHDANVATTPMSD
jgi:hypothetical protein